MDAQATHGNTAAMDEITRYRLMDKAEELALQTFGQSAEAEHIEAVFERLLWAWLHGLPADGAATIH